MSILGIDIGGTKVAMGLVDNQGRVSRKEIFPAEASRGADHLRGTLLAKVSAYRETEELEAIGIGFPGPVSTEAGQILESVNLPGWEGMELCSLFPAEWQLPVFAANDANAAAMGEWKYGAGQGTTNFIYLTISTGIGAGIIAEGGLVSGKNGYAGELGHTVLMQDGPICSCGNRGCWEALSSGTAIAQIARTKLSENSLIYDFAQGDSDRITAKTVFMAFAQGDALATHILEESAHWTGMGIHNLAHTLNPERIAIGGGVGLSTGKYLEMIRASLVTYTKNPLSLPELVFARLGDEVGVIGSAALAVIGE